MINLLVLISDKVEFELYTSFLLVTIAWFLGWEWREAPDVEGSCKYVK
jgi:hypothetical protein